MGDDTLGMTYEMRRQSRGAEPPEEAHPWRRRLIRGGIAVVCITVVVSTYFVWRAVAFVRTTRASVWAKFIDVSPEVDAPMLQLLVRTGDKVTEGQELARLDDTRFKEALVAAQAAAAAKESLYQQAQANKELVGAQVSADVELADAQLQVATWAVAGAEAALKLRQAQLAGEIARAGADAKQAQAWLDQTKNGPRAEEIQAAEARLASAKALQALNELEVKQSEQLVVEGIDSQHILEVKKTQLATQKNAVREAELQLKMLQEGPTAEQIEVQAQNLASRQAAHELAKAGAEDLERLKADLETRKAELRQAQARLKRARATSEGLVKLAQENLVAAQAELEASKAEVAARTTQLSHTIVRSPAAGTVMRTDREEGEFCPTGVRIVLVTDDSKGRWIRGLIREKDSRHVEVGQAAKVRVGTARGKYYDAKVATVGGATFSATSSRTGSADDSAQWGLPGQVSVTLELLEEPEDRPLPGMSARVVIRVW